MGTDSQAHVPPDKLVQNIDILLHVRHLHRLLGIENGERRERGTVVEVASAGLEEAANEEDLKEGVRILEELELTAGCD